MAEIEPSEATEMVGNGRIVTFICVVEDSDRAAELSERLDGLVAKMVLLGRTRGRPRSVGRGEDVAA